MLFDLITLIKRSSLLGACNKNRAKKRILHCIPFFEYLSGYEEDLSVRYAAAAGYEVIVITSWYSIKKANSTLSSRLNLRFKEQIDGATIYRLPGIILPSGASFALGTLLLVLLLMPDVLHIHGLASPNGWLIALIGNLVGAQVLSDSHDYVYSTHQLADIGKSLYKRLRYLEFTLIRRRLGQIQLAMSDSVICYEKKTEQFLRDFYLFTGPVNNVYLGYEEKYFYTRVKKKYSEKKVIGFVGQVSERKRLENLLYILDQLGDNYLLLVIGEWDPKCKKKFLTLASELRLDSRVILKEDISYSKVGSEIRKMDVAIYLYSSSISCNQILACGVPLIMAKGQQFESAARSYGFVIEAETPQELVKESARLVIKELDSLTTLNFSAIEKLSYIQLKMGFKQTFKTMERLYGAV